jgi:hypothetical protein
MYYSRLVGRNNLTGWGYMARNKEDPITESEKQIGIHYLEGELRRMEADQLAAGDMYASMAGINRQQAEKVLRAFLGIPEPDCGDCNASFGRHHGAHVRLGRCYKHTVYGVSQDR